MTTGCEILLHLATSRYISQEKGVESELACFVRLPIVSFKLFLYFFVRQKSKKISHQHSAMDALEGF